MPSVTLRFFSLSFTCTIKVNRNVPVTIQHYSDDEIMFDLQKLGENEAKVLVTSNCQSSNIIPQVSWDAESMDVQDVQASDTLFFIDSSSYHAEWYYEIPGCRSQHYVVSVWNAGYKNLNLILLLVNLSHPWLFPVGIDNSL